MLTTAAAHQPPINTHPTFVSYSPLPSPMYSQFQISGEAHPTNVIKYASPCLASFSQERNIIYPLKASFSLAARQRTPVTENGRAGMRENGTKLHEGERV